MSDLGYVPNHVARSLRSSRTGTIALVVTDVTNPFFTTIARGAEDAASAAENLLLLCNTDEKEEEEVRYMRMLVEKRIDGLVLVPARNGSESLEYARRNGVQVVVVDRRASISGIDNVRCDSEGGAQQLARLLINLGHRRFAIIAGPKGLSTSDDRVRGFLGEIGNSGIEHSMKVLYGEFTPEDGIRMSLEALQAEKRPTAIFAANNFLAIGALRAADSLGLKVPEDLAVVGFDDLPPRILPYPFLTVAAQPAYEMGQQAVKLLLRRLDGEEGDPQEIVLPTEVIIRRSSGDPLKQ